MTVDKKWEIKKLGELSREELKTFIGYQERDIGAFSGRPLARVFTAENNIQGDYLVGILDQEGIPALYLSHRDTAFDGIYQQQWGFGTVITLEEDAHRARTIIESVLETMEKEGEAAGEPAAEETPEEEPEA